MSDGTTTMAASAQPGLWKRHELFEKNSILLIIGILIVVAIGGLIEIAPLFYLKSTIEKVEGMRPYTPLELAGRNIYIREGCYLCHSQMVRPMRDEVERYGHFSLAAESMYDHPFQWGSKRTGPDLARVGGKYSDEWHRDHLKNPKSVVPSSIMPAYPFLDRPLDAATIGADVKANRALGVPYTDDMVKNARGDLLAQANPDDPAAAGFQQRYPNVAARDFDGDPKRVTELDALVSYLQMLGTLVDFKIYENKQNLR
jgi:cytochrome c oxidase cbb3-type subunit 2